MHCCRINKAQQNQAKYFGQEVKESEIKNLELRK